MKEDIARRIRDRRTEHPDTKPCQHFQLELIWTEAGESMGTYACTHCGIEVCLVPEPNTRLRRVLGPPGSTERWAEQEAERIVDMFIAHNGPDDLLKLQELITQALYRAYETARATRLPFG